MSRLSVCWALVAGCPYIGADLQAARLDGDGDGVARPMDCDDTDPDIGEPVLVWLDEDRDNWGDPAAPIEVCTPSFDHTDRPGDCDPENGSVYPGADEFVGDDIDQNCDGVVLCWLDSDGDGFGSDERIEVEDDGDGRCGWNADEARTADDCNDEDEDIHPGATEQCDYIDNDCDSSTRGCWGG